MKQQLRNRARQRIVEKRVLRGAGEVVTDINKALAKYPDLNERQKDFAFRYAIEQRTQKQWSNYYNVSRPTIINWLQNPRIRSLIQEIQYDSRKYVLGMQSMLIKESLDQYLRIFRKQETDDNIESKRKAADKVLEFFMFQERKAPPGVAHGAPITNVYLNSGSNEQQEKNVTPEDVMKKLEEMQGLTDIMTQVRKSRGEYEEADNRSDRSEG